MTSWRPSGRCGAWTVTRSQRFMRSRASVWSLNGRSATCTVVRSQVTLTDGSSRNGDTVPRLLHHSGEQPRACGAAAMGAWYHLSAFLITAYGTIPHAIHRNILLAPPRCRIFGCHVEAHTGLGQPLLLRLHHLLKGAA